MKLTDLDPRWLVSDGKRVGFIFKSPSDPRWYQSCVISPTTRGRQHDLFDAALADQFGEFGWTKVQGCKPECSWTVLGGIDNATFETMTVTPSLDGSPGGLWHGFITNGVAQ